MGIECNGDVPFTNCLIHGLVRDDKGRKMSKSLGNGIDPLDIVRDYGADTLRIALVKDMAMGMDTRFSQNKVDDARTFINKVWNASKFISMHQEGITMLDVDSFELNDVQKWILFRLDEIKENVVKNLDNFDVGVALTNIVSFTLDVFCDWAIELSKPAIFEGGESKQKMVSVLGYAFSEVLKLLHPFIPYVTEYIYQNSKQLKANGKLLMLSDAPEAFDVANLAQGYELTEKVIDAIKKLRNLKVENNITINVKPKVSAPTEAKVVETIINKLAGVELFYQEITGKVVMTSLGKFTLQEDVVNKDELIKQIKAEMDKLGFEIKRSSGMLNNAGFVAKAPQKLIEAEQQKLASNKAKYAELESKLKAL